MKRIAARDGVCNPNRFACGRQASDKGGREAETSRGRLAADVFRRDAGLPQDFAQRGLGLAALAPDAETAGLRRAALVEQAFALLHVGQALEVVPLQQRSLLFRQLAQRFLEALLRVPLGDRLRLVPSALSGPASGRAAPVRSGPTARRRAADDDAGASGRG